MANEPANERQDEVRRSVRGFLAERPQLAFHPRVIASSPYVQAALSETNTALAVLTRLKQVEQEHDSLGSTPYFRITGDGILAHERGGLQ